MQTAADVARLLGRVKYRPELCGGFRIVDMGNHFYLQHEQMRPDATRPAGYEIQRGRKWLLSRHMTDGEVLQTALMAVLAFEEHEAREAFQLDGVRIFSPHKSVAALMAAEEEKRLGATA